MNRDSGKMRGRRMIQREPPAAPAISKTLRRLGYRIEDLISYPKIPVTTFAGWTPVGF